jgi:site-specific recombinase XerD
MSHLMPETVKHLKKYLSVLHPDEHMHSESYLFFTRHKGQKVQMCDDTARYRIQRYAAAAKENCPDVPGNPHPHMWRHTRAMHLYQHGMDLERISQWLGHSQLETTLIYAHSDTEDKRKAIAAALGDGVTGQLNNAPYTVDDEEILRKLYGL